MKLKDFARLKGEVLIQSINEFGEISTLVEDKNLIVSYGRNNICNGLVGNPSSYVYDVVFGNGGTIPGNVNVALSVSPGEVAVKSPISASNGKDYIFTKVAETSPSPRAIFSIILPMTPQYGFLVLWRIPYTLEYLTTTVGRSKLS